MAGLVTGCRLSAIGSATFTVSALLTAPFVATTTGPEVAPSGTRATTKASELITTAPSIWPNCTRGRFSSVGRKPLPLIRISPPGKAAAGDTFTMWGLPFTCFLPSRRLEIPMKTASSWHSFRCKLAAEQTEMQEKLHDGQAIKPGGDIVYHNSRALRQPFQLPHGRWFHNIECPKKYKAR